MNIWEMPKVGQFRIETGDYDPVLGWVQKIEEIKIIGEENEHYVERTQPLNYGLYDENGIVQNINTIIGIGPHKTRLVKWIETQLQLNFYE